MSRPLTVAPAHVGPGADSRAGLIWRLPEGTASLSSAAVGGGSVHPRWVANLGVMADYARTDLDAHAAEFASTHGLTGVGVLLLTAADVTKVQSVDDHGVRSDVTVGLGKPTWAASDHDGWSEYQPGTINIIVQLPVPLSPAAAVNAVITATEAKSQALHEAAVPGTGTASDAVVVLWPTAGTPELFAGPRSPWGARIARSVHAAVTRDIKT